MLYLLLLCIVSLATSTIVTPTSSQQGRAASSSSKEFSSSSSRSWRGPAASAVDGSLSRWPKINNLTLHIKYLAKQHSLSQNYTDNTYIHTNDDDPQTIKKTRATKEHFPPKSHTWMTEGGEKPGTFAVWEQHAYPLS